MLKDDIARIISDDLIYCNSTHEHAPPGYDCGDKCGVSIEDQIAASNPVMAPMRSGGAKHKKCLECWNEYIDGLTKRLFNHLKEKGYGKMDEEFPYTVFNPITLEDK